MPELIEVEVYRRVAEQAVGRRIAEVRTPDTWYLKGTTAAELVAALTGATVTGTRRIGKLLMLDTDADHVLGLRFGMTGRLIVDERNVAEGGNNRGDRAGSADVLIGDLMYGSKRDEPEWDRFTMRFRDGGVLRMQDPRRLGGVELDPEEARLGPEASTITTAALREVLAGSTTALKARLMDQHRLAGMGNLLVDETLWRAGLDPAREAGSLSASEVRQLAAKVRSTIAQLSDRGGSHTGDLQIARTRGALCPRDGAALLRRTIGGRTTFSCPVHQR